MNTVLPFASTNTVIGKLAGALIERAMSSSGSS